jgi:hypothetical protein
MDSEDATYEYERVKFASDQMLARTENTLISIAALDAMVFFPMDARNRFSLED